MKNHFLNSARITNFGKFELFFLPTRERLTGAYINGAKIKLAIIFD